MKIDYQQLEYKAGKALRSCLGRVPFLKIKSFQKNPYKNGLTADFTVTLSLTVGNQVLLVEVRNNGQPRVTHEAINQLLRYREKYPRAYPVFIAPYISPQSAHICSEESIGYMDLAGNCRLSFKNVYIEQEGKPNLFKEKRDLRSLYSPKAARILRVLLNNPKKAWKMNDMVNEAKVSLGLVANVKKLLDDREWIFTQSDGFSLSEPEKLLTEWSKNYTYRKNRIINYYSLKNVAEIESELPIICNKRNIEYALTGFSGGARLAPAVRYQRIFAYVGNAMEEIAALLNLKEVSSGPNVTLLSPYDEGVFYDVRIFDGIRIATPVQIYLDLLGFKGRGEEAANTLLEEVIKPAW